MGAYLSEPKRDKDSENQSGDGWDLGASSMQGWRANMEDAHLVLPSFGGDSDTFLVGVFDGHGGQEVAKFVAKHLGEEVLANEHYQGGDGNIGEALRSSFLNMDDKLFRPHYRKELARWKNKGSAQNIFAQIVQLASANEDGGPDPFSGLGGPSSATSANEDEEKAKEEEEDFPPELKDTDPKDQVQAGCTAVVAWRRKNKLIVANAGDSRAVLCRDGVAVALSNDHKPELPEETDRIKKAAGWIENGRVNGNLNLSRAIGDLTYKKNSSLTPEEQAITANPELTTWELQDTDEFIIMGCDGIWEIKSNQEVCDFVKQRLPDTLKEKKPLSSICEEFMDSILSEDITKTEGMGCDNMTMIIILLKKD
ncbi:unnamed protein product [Amoebophrya sp. A120]|nr:unnamed protein product [Amoebophrya sp. A120]|eukprot:GSA120T00023598001.1